MSMKVGDDHEQPQNNNNNNNNKTNSNSDVNTTPPKQPLFGNNWDNMIPTTNFFTLGNLGTTPIFTIDNPTPTQNQTNIDLSTYKPKTETYTQPSDATRVAKREHLQELKTRGFKDVFIHQKQYETHFNVKENLFEGTAEDLNRCLANTPLKGQGQAFIDAQQKYHVNALFLMGIVNTESTYGKVPAKNTIHNVAGLKNSAGKYQNNPSYYDCIDSLGNSLKKLYFNGKPKRVTVEQIRQLFCKGKIDWSGKVCREMNRLSGVIQQSYR